MAKKHYVLGIDPSGDYEVGKGTTGMCLLDTSFNVVEHGIIEAATYSSSEEYWKAHITKILEIYRKYPNLDVVIEDYRLYANRAGAQINSRMATCRLIGILQLWLWDNKIPYALQMAGEVKTRWSDDILKHSGFGDIQIFNKHSVDALRHAVHYIKFKMKGKI